MRFVKKNLTAHEREAVHGRRLTEVVESITMATKRAAEEELARETEDEQSR